MRIFLFLVLIFGFSSIEATGGEADVVGVEVVKDGSGAYRFNVSVSHGDTGWKHYADRWEVLGPDDSVLGTRTLLHPHADEQPFTRSLSGVEIPEGVTEVSVRAHDSVHEYGGMVIRKKLP
jgi:hypothetical protein